MGIRMSRSNWELIDWMVDDDQLNDVRNEVAMRLVDRGRFVPAEEREHIYDDGAWQALDPGGGTGRLHLSAPSIYANALQHLDLVPSMSFLNIGSGTGYLSSVAGFLLGADDINHGVELHRNLVEYAQRRVDKMLRTPQVDLLDWCVPSFFCGNAFQLRTEMRYDRIYVGAGLAEGEEQIFCRLLKIGGRMVAPVGNEMRQITAMQNGEFHEHVISAVVFSPMIRPNAEEDPSSDHPVEIAHVRQPPALSDICRRVIRDGVSNSILKNHPIDFEERCHRGRCLRLAALLTRQINFAKQRIEEIRRDLAQRTESSAEEVQVLDYPRATTFDPVLRTQQQLDEMYEHFDEIKLTGAEEMEALRELGFHIDRHLNRLSELHHYLLEEAELERAQQHQTEEGEQRMWRRRRVHRENEGGGEEDDVDDGQAAGLENNHNGRTLTINGETFRNPTRWGSELRHFHKAFFERMDQLPLPDPLRRFVASHD